VYLKFANLRRIQNFITVNVDTDSKGLAKKKPAKKRGRFGKTKSVYRNLVGGGDVCRWSARFAGHEGYLLD